MKTLRIAANGQAFALGPLETRLMSVFWERPGGWLTVSDVLDAMRGSPRLSYSAIKTVLTNLVAKGHLRKRPRGRANEFTADQSREAFDRAMMRDVVRPLLRQYGNPLLAHIIEALESDTEIGVRPTPCTQASRAVAELVEGLKIASRGQLPTSARMPLPAGGVIATLDAPIFARPSAPPRLRALGAVGASPCTNAIAFMLVSGLV